jgi:hypothetical protein
MENYKMIFLFFFFRLLDIVFGLRLLGFHLDFAMLYDFRSLDVGLDVNLNVDLVINLDLSLGFGGCFLNFKMTLYGSFDLRLLNPGFMSVGHHLKA